MTAVIENMHPRPTDAELAKGYRERAEPMLKELCALMNEMRANEMKLTFGVGVDGFGRSVVQQLDVIRVF